MAVVGWYVLCDGKDCTEKRRLHYHGKSPTDGWHFAKRGKTYCPLHKPEGT